MLFRHISLVELTELEFMSECDDTNDCKSDVAISKGYPVDKNK